MDQSSYEAEDMQAECIVRAIDEYLACFPWPAPTMLDQLSSTMVDKGQSRQRLVMTIAAAIRMSEPRKSALQR